MADKPDPRIDQDGKPSFLLQRQIRGYKKLDPPEKQQVTLTGSVIKELISLALTSLEKAMSELFTGAFFFAMRSCEYLKVAGKRRTKIVTLKNVRFFKGRKELNHSKDKLDKADSVSITFELQKRDAKFDTVTHHRSKDKTICPVIIWAKIIKRIRSYPKSSDNTTVNTFREEFSKEFSEKMIINEKFFTIPTTNSDNSLTSRRPRNLPCNNNGLQFKEAARPLVSVFH